MSNDNFVWTDELVVEFTTWSLTHSPLLQGRYSDVEQFKKRNSKQQKEWEVVSYKNPHSDHIIMESDVSSISHNYPIFSVKRLSDGEIFSIGDVLEWDRIVDSIKVVEFKRYNDILFAHSKNDGGVNIVFAKKYNKVNERLNENLQP